MMFKAVLAMLAALLVLQAFVYCVHCFHRSWCVERAVSGGCESPGSFFLEAFFGVGVASVGVLVLSVIVVFLGSPYVLFVVIPATLYGWIVLRKEAAKEEAERREVALRFPVARLQFRIPDLWAASVAFGGVMMALLGLSRAVGRPEAAEIGAIAVYAVAVETAAFLVAMDVCRRSEALQASVSRALYTILLMMAAAIPPCPLLMLVAWGGWRYGLWKSQAEKLSAEKRLEWLEKLIEERRAKAALREPAE